MTNAVDGVDLGRLSAFEVSFQMQKLAQDNKDHLSYLNAGRGNPNWINVETRLALARLMEWGCVESQRTYSQGAMAGFTEESGMGQRFDAFLATKNDAISVFLAQAIQWCCDHEAMNKEDLLKELADAVVGNTYPSPGRCLTHVEKIINSYLQSALYDGVDLKDSTDLFACEGGTAAMCYAFDSLKHNGLLRPGDKIALNTPIFTPYLEIPKLEDFQLVEIDLSSKEDGDWEIDIDQFDKLLDPAIKAFFLVNPSNPGSKALSKAALDKLEQVCQARRDLMIITDDVYGTFVDGFQTVYARVPYNTLLVYSFSKLFGVTGWRLGLIALNKDNVFDHLISQVDDAVKRDLDNDYSIVSTDVASFPFIDRLCADSRNIALYHTAGLSTPQQTMMALMSLSHLIQGDKDGYIGLTKEILDHRYKTLYETLGIPFDRSADNAEYYTLIDMYQLAARKYSAAFSQWLRTSFNQADFMIDLAREDGVVLVEGIGFDATPGTLRVSFANLVDTDYEAIAKRILAVLDQYYQKHQGAQSGGAQASGTK